MPASSDYEIEIERLREERRPTPVALHEYPKPNWLRIRLLKKFGARDRDTSWWAMHQWLGPMFGYGRLDHWGTTKLENGYTAFVTEPYGDIANLSPVMEFVARHLGCDWLVSENSWWCPGGTIRGALYEGPESIPADKIVRVEFDPILHSFSGGER